MTIHRYEALDSTNNEAARMASALAHGDVLVCRTQTAGRGQRGNTWESEPGKNLTFSVFLRPAAIKASDAFLLSMAVSVGIVDALNRIVEPERIAVKWPNDIYWNDMKLAGILIENSFQGQSIGHSIVGIGLNINQKKFVSDAPNPVSLANISGKKYDLDDTLKTVVEEIVKSVDNIGPGLSERYHNMLWRGEGIHLWREPGGEPFEASIERVLPTGHLVLATSSGLQTYAFKEVAPIL